MRVMEQPELCAASFEMLADYIQASMQGTVRPTKVLGAAVGGIIAAHSLAGMYRRCDAIFAERINGQLELRRGFQIAPGDRVIIVEDVITTGKTSNELLKLVTAGADIICVASLVNRSRLKFLQDHPLISLAQLETNEWEEADCPLCKQDIKLNTPGSRFIQG